MLEAAAELQKYYPNRSIANLDEEAKRLAQNHFTVINCAASELEGRLKKMAPGRKQIAISRYEDQVTVIVNELDVLF